MKYVVGNWKMYLEVDESVALSNNLLAGFKASSKMPEVVLCPSFDALSGVSVVLRGSNLHLGAQDSFWNDEGAHTGSVGPKMLKDDGVSYVIVGHSERRAELGETNEQVSKKAVAILEHGLNVIVCVGETLKLRESGNGEVFVREELRASLAGVKNSHGLFIAYEPLWAISKSGSGKAAVVSEFEAMCSMIREELKELFGEDGARVPILYGGSVNPENAVEVLKSDVINGVLVGHASTNYDSLMAIIKAAQTAS